MTTTKLEVARFGGDTAEWDDFVRTSEGWTHFHLSGWKRVIEDVFGHECLYLVARTGADREVAGVLPLVRVRSLLFGHYLVSMPFLNYGGPLGNHAAVRALVNMAVRMAADDRVKLLELRNRRELEVSVPVSHRKITVLLDLPEGDIEPLWKSLKAKVRSQVRRPQKEGMTVEFGPGQVGPFYEVFSRHMRDLGTPSLPRRFFEAIAEAFPDDAWFGCTYHDGKPVACGCGFKWNGEFEMTWASSLKEYSRMAPNMLLYWRFMERCVAEGIRLFNFGRCTPGGGTHRFKVQWGSREQQLWWYQSGARLGASTPSPDQGAYSWGPRIWRHIPLPVANTVGPRIVQYIP
jgi:FemAB-related protein (PEP-CTERM system-associated)